MQMNDEQHAVTKLQLWLVASIGQCDVEMGRCASTTRGSQSMQQQTCRMRQHQYMLLCASCVHRDGVLVHVWFVRWQVYEVGVSVVYWLFGSGIAWLLCLCCCGYHGMAGSHSMRTGLLLITLRPKVQ